MDPTIPADEEKRRAARIRFRASDHLEVRYKFLSHVDDLQCDTIFKGAVLNLSKGGALFAGALPGPEWLQPLRDGQIMIGVNLMNQEDRIKVLASLRWSQLVKDPRELALAPEEGPYFQLGVQFEQLDAASRNSLSKLLIGQQLRTRRFEAH